MGWEDGSGGGLGGGGEIDFLLGGEGGTPIWKCPNVHICVCEDSVNVSILNDTFRYIPLLITLIIYGKFI